MSKRHGLSKINLKPSNISSMVDQTVHIISRRKPGRPLLIGNVVGIYFRNMPTRTRISFTGEAPKLGASVIAYGPNNVQINTGETIQNTTDATQTLIDLISKPSGTIFMHDLLAVREEAVSSAVSDRSQRIALYQAHNKMYPAMAILEWCALDPHAS